MCLLAKLFRKKLIFIESFSKITSPTITGKLLYKHADLFLVQWEDMKSFILTQSMGNILIFITVGSQKFQFDRLLKEIDRLVEEKQLNSEEVFAQIGYSTYEPCHYSYQKF